ncbi:MAG: hypothetical protein JNK04_20310, partial [Myxococcales bacterium]|nr:hypothetical protein [Myxococcales bacterium]
LNAKVNLPIMGEETEKQVLMTALKQLNSALAGKVGEELRAIIQPLIDGSATPDEAVALKAKAVEHVNKHINIPVIGEDTEAKILGPVVDGIVDVTRSNLG